MDPKTENNPYLGFIYTSFQERATKVRTHEPALKFLQAVSRRAVCLMCCSSRLL
jgi:hypothetical protein